MCQNFRLRQVSQIHDFDDFKELEESDLSPYYRPAAGVSKSTGATMKKKLLLLLLLLSVTGCGEDESKSDREKVYICTGNGSYAYHKNDNCSGLNNCQAEIISTSLKKAKKKRRACKICYK